MTGRSYACSTLQEELRDEGLLFVGVSPDEGGFGTDWDVTDWDVDLPVEYYRFSCCAQPEIFRSDRCSY